jgi:hypothetical protein
MPLNNTIQRNDALDRKEVLEKLLGQFENRHPGFRLNDGIDKIMHNKTTG